MKSKETGSALKLNRTVFILSIIGVVMAVYVLQSFLRQSSIICVNEGCELVRKSPLSYPFGIPVPAFGLAGYSLLIILTFLRTTNPSRSLLKGMMGIAVFGILFVTWFTATEIFIIKALCTWCVLSAINMYIIFFLVLRIFKEEKKKK